MTYNTNIKTYYWYSVFAELLILGPVMVLFLTAKGLSFTEIMILQSIYACSIVAFEVPTGVVADKIGRKHSMLLGALLMAVSLGIYVVGKEFFIFALAEMMFSLGTSFKSGADTAILYDSLKSSGNEKEFQRIEGRAKSFSLCAQAIGAIIAGFVYEINISLPMIISAGFMLITAVIASMFLEPKIEEKKGKFGIAYFTQVKDSAKYIFGHEKIKAVIFYCMIFAIFSRAGFWYYQPYMESVNIEVKYFGIIFFVFNMTAALASHYSYKFMEITKPRTLTCLSGFMIISFMLLGTIHIWFGVFAIMFQQISRGLYRPVTTKYLNKNITSDKRATILSFQSLASNLAVSITFPFIGLLKDNADIFTSHITLGVIMLILTYITTRYMNKRLGVKEIINKETSAANV